MTNFEKAKQLFQDGVNFLSENKLELAEENFLRSLEFLPGRCSTLINLAATQIRLKKYGQAKLNLEKVAELEGTSSELYINLALLSYEECKFEAAICYLDECLKLEKNNIQALSLKAKIHIQLRQTSNAINCFHESLRIEPNNYDVLLNLSATLIDIKEFCEAKKVCTHAVKIYPKSQEILVNLGISYFGLKEFQLSLDTFNKSLEINSNDASTWLNKGNTLHTLKNYSDALYHYDKALEIDPNSSEIWLNRGNTLHELRRYQDALTNFDRALELNRQSAEIWLNRGNTLNELRRYDEALSNYDSALALKNDYLEAWSNKGNVLSHLNQHSKSAECYFQALKIQDDKAKNAYLLGQAHHQMMLACDWKNYSEITHRIFNEVKQGQKSADPFGFQGISQSEELLRKCAEIYSSDKYPNIDNLSGNGRYQHKKIRIGYLCGEFRYQATSILMTRIWELHDKSQFDIYAFDNGTGDNSDYRLRIEKAFNHIFNISNLSDYDAAKLIRSHEIDILINLNGFFGLARQGVFSYRPAPIQVNYLGFPGTIGAPYIDYIIADKVVIPNTSIDHYVEKVVHLPHSYQANDNLRAISKKKYTKKEFGLPENSFIYANFNNNYKITPETFDSWCAILKEVKNSVLWLLADNPQAQGNLVQEATLRDIDPSRLIFAKRLNLPEHLARHQLADLFLDTNPYNAHTTASDALWSGLPLLTLVGETFPARVSASLLNALELYELIATNQRDYIDMAIELGRHPGKIQKIKNKLLQNRECKPLFNSELFTKDIETAYIYMYRRFESGLPPDHIDFS